VLNTEFTQKIKFFFICVNGSVILCSTASNDSMMDVRVGVKRNATFHDVVVEGRKDDDVEIDENGNMSVAMSSSQSDGRVCSSDVLVTYCDVLGIYHHGMKLQKKSRTQMVGNIHHPRNAVIQVVKSVQEWYVIHAMQHFVFL
jgi:hypothetical protein